LISALVCAKLAALAKRPRIARAAATVSDFICMIILQMKLLKFDAEIQALRITKKIKATIRMSPSKPPPMYMRFPFY
jgi:hypothetical protein